MSVYEIIEFNKRRSENFKTAKQALPDTPGLLELAGMVTIVDFLRRDIKRMNLQDRTERLNEMISSHPILGN
jgi:hypothetical protein